MQCLLTICLNPENPLNLNNNLFFGLTDNVHDFEYFDFFKLPSKFYSANGLLVLHINIRSLQKHIDELHELIINAKIHPDLVAITETRIKNKPLINIDIPGYSFSYETPSSNAGGVGIYVGDNLNFNIIENYNISISSCENLWLKIKCKNYSEYIIGVIYRHPNHIDINDFNLQLNEILQYVSSSGHKCIALGDFNIDLFN